MLSDLWASLNRLQALRTPLVLVSNEGFNDLMVRSNLPATTLCCCRLCAGHP